MTTTADRPTVGEPGEGILQPEPITVQPFPIHRAERGSLFLRMIRTTDHKLIGRMYLVTSFAVLHARRRAWRC